MSNENKKGMLYVNEKLIAETEGMNKIWKLESYVMKTIP